MLPERTISDEVTSLVHLVDLEGRRGATKALICSINTNEAIGQVKSMTGSITPLSWTPVLDDTQSEAEPFLLAENRLRKQPVREP